MKKVCAWLTVFPAILISISGEGQNPKAVAFSETEAGAIGHVRTLATAEFAYFYSYKALACSLSDLGSSKNSPEGPHSAGLIYDNLASGKLDGYSFLIRCEGSASLITASPVAGQNEKAHSFCAEITRSGDDAGGGLIHFSENAARCQKDGKLLP